MTHLRDEMYDTYATVHINLDRLATDAQLQGGRVRRRNRRLAATASTLAVIAAVGLGTWATTGPPDAGGEAHDAVPLARAPSVPRTLTGMEALETTLVAAVPGGTVSGISKLSVDHDGDDPYAKGALTFTAPGAEFGGVISLTTFPAPDDTSGFGDCDQYRGYPNCEVTTLPDGSVLLTHDVPVWNGPSESKKLGTSVAGVLVSHGMVVSLDARIPFEDGGETQPLSPDAPLTTQQVKDVLSQPEWGQLDALG